MSMQRLGPLVTPLTPLVAVLTGACGFVFLVLDAVELASRPDWLTYVHMIFMAAAAALIIEYHRRARKAEGTARDRERFEATRLAIVANIEEAGSLSAQVAYCPDEKLAEAHEAAAEWGSGMHAMLTGYNRQYAKHFGEPVPEEGLSSSYLAFWVTEHRDRLTELREQMDVVTSRFH